MGVLRVPGTVDVEIALHDEAPSGIDAVVEVWTTNRVVAYAGDDCWGRRFPESMDLETAIETVLEMRGVALQLESAVSRPWVGRFEMLTAGTLDLEIDQSIGTVAQ